MAPSVRAYSSKTRSPSPVARSRRRTRLSKLLGNLRHVYKRFPELSPSNQHSPSSGHLQEHPAKDSHPEGTISLNAPPPANRALPLHSVRQSPLATRASPTPRLGNLDKLWGLDLRSIGGSIASSPESKDKSTGQACIGLQTQVQGSLHISSGHARLQRVQALSVHNPNSRDSALTGVETESPLDRDDGSVDDLVSKVTTPATSPDFTLDIQAKIDAIVNKAATSGTSHDNTTQPPRAKVIVPEGLWPGVNPACTPHRPSPQLPSLPPCLSSGGPPSNLVHFQDKARRYRSDIAARVTNNFAVLRPGETITLPWDEHGDYTVRESSSHQRLGVSFGSNKSAYIIEPHYRVDKATQLKIVKARLAQLDSNRQMNHANPIVAQVDTSPVVADHALVGRSGQSVHVFVDMSNISIGFYNYMRQERNLPSQQRIQASFFFGALATILERERPCAKRVVVGSMGPGAPWEDYMFEAQSSGYTMHILQRVKGSKPSKQLTQTPPSNFSPNNIGNVHHEQAVDEILQLHMLQSIIDTPTSCSESGEPLSPGTIVLATGDGAEAEFSDGFFNNALRALRHGWCVEIVGFQRNMNQVWNEQAIPAEWRANFRKIFLDGFAEELLASFRG